MTNEDNLVALFKLGQKAHMEEVLHEGHVYMNTVAHFAALEDGSPRADPDEGTAFSRNADGATLKMQHGDEWHTLGKVRGTVRLRDDALLPVNLYCLHGLTRSDYGQVFQLDQLGFGESYVLLIDADEFLRRLSDAIAKVGHRMSWNIVKYVDRGDHHGAMGVFRKYAERAADREVRVAALPGSGGPLSLHLGNLSDIAMIGNSSDRLKLEPKMAG
jgi:hypothetical protein